MTHESYGETCEPKGAKAQSLLQKKHQASPQDEVIQELKAPARGRVGRKRGRSMLEFARVPWISLILYVLCFCFDVSTSNKILSLFEEKNHRQGDGWRGPY